MNNMKILTIVLLLIMGMLLETASAAPVIEWSKTFPEADIVVSINQTSDGGYVFIGRSSSYYQIPLLIKTDSLGNKQWSKVIGQYRYAHSVKQTSDDGYVIVGTDYGQGNANGRGWVMKTDPSGNKQWENILPGPEDGELFSVIQTNGQYVAVGHVEAKGYRTALLVKIYPSGQTDWSKRFGPGSFVDISQTKDGGYVMGSYYYPDRLSKIIVTDWSGTQKLTKTMEYGYEIKSVRQTKDGGYITASDYYDYPSDHVRLSKMDASGNQKWYKIYKTTTENNEINSVRQTKDGEYVAVGARGHDSNLYPGEWDEGRIIKTDSLGNQKWLMKIGANIKSVEITKDGGYIVAGGDVVAGSDKYKALIAKVTDLEWAGWQKIGLEESVNTLIVGHDNIKGKTVVYYVHQKSGDIYKYDGVPFSWTKIGGSGKTFVVTNNGQFYGLSPDGSGVWKWDGVPNQWTQVGGPAGNIYGGGDNLIATNPENGDVYRYNDIPLSWTKIGGPGKTFAVGDGNRIYAISPDGKGVWKWDESPERWTQIGGSAKNIYAGGTALYMTSPKSGHIYKYNGVPFSWTKIGGPGKTFAVTSNGQLYGLSPDGKSIWRWTGVPNKWVQIEDAVKDIFGGAYGNRLYAINYNSDILQYIFSKKVIKI